MGAMNKARLFMLTPRLQARARNCSLFGERIVIDARAGNHWYFPPTAMPQSQHSPEAPELRGPENPRGESSAANTHSRPASTAIASPRSRALLDRAPDGLAAWPT